MAITSYPFDDQQTTETQYSLLFRELQDSGVVGSVTGTAFKLSANGGGMSGTLQAGYAIVRGHAVQSTAVVTVTFAAADTTARTDRVVLRLDPTANTITPYVIKGTPGSGLPARETTESGLYDLPLARVSIPGSAVVITAADVTDDRRFVAGRVGIWAGDAQRPSPARVGAFGLNWAAGKWEFFDGDGWSDVASAVTWSNIAGKPGTFTPEAHSHDWNEVTGKPLSFTPATHAHDYAPAGGAYGFGLVSKGSGHAISLRYDGRPLFRADNIEFGLSPDQHGHSAVSVPSDNNSNVQNDINYLAAVKSNNDHGHYNSTVSRADGSDRPHNFTPAGSGWYAVWVDGNRNFCRNTSSRRYKKNIKNHALDPAKVLALQPRVYDRKDTNEKDVITEGQKNEWGLVAEEVNELVPELVQWHDSGDGKGLVIEAVRYDLVGLALLDVVKDQQSRIEALEAQLADLNKAVEGLLAKRA